MAEPGSEEQGFDPNQSVMMKIGPDGRPVVVGEAKSNVPLDEMPTAKGMAPKPEPPPFQETPDANKVQVLQTPQALANAPTQVDVPLTSVAQSGTLQTSPEKPSIIQRFVKAIRRQ